MKIWVDADACPSAVKDIILRAARRRNVPTVFVANKEMAIPVSELISSVVVGGEPDAADKYIINNAQPFDLVVTQDIPLAYELVPKDIVVIDLRGGEFTKENVTERLSIRNLLAEARDSGQITGGPKQFGEKEKRAFASAFDRELTKMLKR